MVLRRTVFTFWPIAIVFTTSTTCVHIRSLFDNATIAMKYGACSLNPSGGTRTKDHERIFPVRLSLFAMYFWFRQIFTGLSILLLFYNMNHNGCACSTNIMCHAHCCIMDLPMSASPAKLVCYFNQLFYTGSTHRMPTTF